MSFPFVMASICLFHSGWQSEPLIKLTEKLGEAFPTLPFFVAPEDVSIGVFNIRILLLINNNK
jgi:hypothetical protein